MLITDKSPKLDLHGEIESMVEALVNAFIKENYLQNKRAIKIIHGKSKNIIKNETHRVLKNNPYVLEYRLNNWNLGETFVYLKEKKNKR